MGTNSGQRKGSEPDPSRSQIASLQGRRGTALSTPEITGKAQLRIGTPMPFANASDLAEMQQSFSSNVHYNYGIIRNPAIRYLAEI